MDRLYIRNYLLVAVAGMFCLFNASIVSAQTATDLNCSNCVGPGEVAPNSIQYRSLDANARGFLAAQANTVDGFNARLDGNFGALIVAQFTATDNSGVADATCPAGSLVSSANCGCSSDGGTRNFGVLISCRIADRRGALMAIGVTPMVSDEAMESEYSEAGWEEIQRLHTIANDALKGK